MDNEIPGNEAADGGCDPTPVAASVETPKPKWSLPQRSPERDEQVFFVWRDGGRTPLFRHPTYWHCRKEAERLALANRGVRFHIVSTHRIVEAPAAEVSNG